MEKINAQIAQRMREQRQKRGLSLEEVAKRSGVSRAMLSQIETLKTNPTIAVLWKIAAGLEISFSELLELDDRPSARLCRAREARYLYSEDRRFRSRPLLSNVPGHRVELYELQLEAGAAVEAEPHPPGSHEQVIVQSGKLELRSADETIELGPRDALFFAADVPHRYRALGKRDFVGLSLILYP